MRVDFNTTALGLVIIALAFAGDVIKLLGGIVTEDVAMFIKLLQLVLCSVMGLRIWKERRQDGER